MRKVIMFNLITLDGYFEGVPGDIGWHSVDEEFGVFAEEQLKTIGAILFGRVTYEGMAAYWPTPMAVENDPAIAKAMNEIEKYVFSTTFTEAKWQNTTLINEKAAEAVAKLKAQPGKDLFIFGSSDLTVSLMQAGLVDEFRILVNPVVLGGGKLLFAGLKGPYQMKLVGNRTFKNGNVLLTYERGQ